MGVAKWWCLSTLTTGSVAEESGLGRNLLWFRFPDGFGWGMDKTCVLGTSTKAGSQLHHLSDTELWGLEGRGGGGPLCRTAAGTLPEVDVRALPGTCRQRCWAGTLWSQIGFPSGRREVLGKTGRGTAIALASSSPHLLRMPWRKVTGRWGCSLFQAWSLGEGRSPLRSPEWVLLAPWLDPLNRLVHPSHSCPILQGIPFSLTSLGG